MDYKGMPTESGIYIIRNTVNKNVYVGQAENLLVRARGHINAANKGVKHHLYNSMRKHGIDKFSINVLEMCDKPLLDDRENFWIDLYQATEYGYNICKFARSARGTKRTKKQILSITGEFAAKPATVYDSIDNTIKRFISYSSALIYVNPNRKSKGNPLFLVNGYCLVSKRYFIINGRASLSSAIKKYAIYVENKKKHGRPKAGTSTIKAIVQLDPSGNCINRYESIFSAALQMDVNKGNISTAIRIKCKCKGFYWRYEEEVQQAQ